MRKTLDFRSYLQVFGIPLLLIVSLWFLVNSSWFSKYPKELSLAITVDLLITIPFVFFLLIRKKNIPKITIVSCFVLGLIIASYILPENQQTFLSQVKTYFFPLVEIGILTFLFIKVRKTIKEFKKLNTTDLDFFDAIQMACKESFPKGIATLLATEIAVIYYGFFQWKKRVLKDNEFTNYKENGLISLLLAVLLVVFIETFAFHKLAEKWSITLAWVLTAISIYTAIQLFALIKSLSKRPFIVDENNQQLILRFGFFSKAIIPFKEIGKLEINSKDLPDDKSIVPFSPLGTLGGHNVVIYLKDEIEFLSLYHFKKKAKALAISVDEKSKFVAFVSKNITL